MNITYETQKNKPKRQKNFEEIMNEPHYRSIINLTKLCDKGKGLRPMHYRYVLIPDHDGIKSPFKFEMKKFFNDIKEDALNAFTMEIAITEGSITSKSNLSNFLHKLVNDYKILTVEEGKYNINRYKINENIKDKIIKFEINRILSRFNSEELQAIQKIIDKIYIKVIDIEGFFNNPNYNEKKKLNENDIQEI